MPSRRRREAADFTGLPRRAAARASAPVGSARGERHGHDVRQAWIAHLLLLGSKAGVERLRGLGDVFHRGEAVAGDVHGPVNTLQRAHLPCGSRTHSFPRYIGRERADLGRVRLPGKFLRRSELQVLVELMKRYFKRADLRFLAAAFALAGGLAAPAPGDASEL